MEKTVRIRCRNNGASIEVPMGSKLEQIYEMLGLNMEYEPVVALVNNKVEGLHFRVYKPKDLQFLDIRSNAGIRAYTRTLFFVLCKAVRQLYSHGHVIIDIPVSNGYHCNLKIGHEVTQADIDRIRQKMQDIIDAARPIRRHEIATDDAIGMFRRCGASTKAKLLESVNSIYSTYYEIDGYVDYYYSAMLTNTSQLTLFGLEPYFGGVLLRIPSQNNPRRLGALVRQDKMFDIFKEHHEWQRILGLNTVGDLNEVILNGRSNQLIQVSEALQEKKIATIADAIKANPDIKIVLIAGPSSSGKTTTCKRISVQLAVNGIRPVALSLDDYFQDRELTPRDATGDYDFEHLHALNLDLLNEQMNALLRGDEVELPRYNFHLGKREWSGKKLRMKEGDVLVVEGIHALNPELTAHVPQHQIYRVYASALTTLLLDSHNYVPTTDNRLLRRIIRDHKYRGVSAQETIRRWPSVRKGENRWIFPFQENADVMFNTAMLFELAVIRRQAEPLLEQVPENCVEYAEAHRLLKFLKYIRPIPEDQIPPTSLLREFLGGSSFEY